MSIKKLKSGHEVVPLGKDEEEKIKKYFPAYVAGTIRINPGSFFYLAPFANFADKIYDFEFRSTDILINTWPKCGTTWMQEIVWTMTNNPNFNNDKADVPIMFRSPFMEFDSFTEDYPDSPQMQQINSKLKEILHMMCPGEEMEKGVALQIARNAPNPRVLKTHLPFSLFHPNLLEKCKVIYVARNPKDACLSYLHHHRLVSAMNFTGTDDEFIDFFMNDCLLWSPLWAHIKEGWERRNHENFLWVFYEDLKKDQMKEMKRINEFLNTNVSDKHLQQIIEYSKFSNMQKRDPAYGIFNTEKGNIITNDEYEKEKGNFFRKGIVGDWKNGLTDDQNNKMNEWIKKHSEEIGIQFQF